MRSLFLTACLTAMFFAPAAWAADDLPPGERAHLKLAFGLADAVADEIWPGWGTAPRTTILVTRPTEFMICTDRPPEGYGPLASNPELGCPVFARANASGRLPGATFTIVGRQPTVIIAPPLRTDRAWLPWIATWAHEHFHQWQMSQPDYIEAAEALGLGGDDTSGAWMVEYPFPYDDPGVGRAFKEMTRALDAAQSALGAADGSAALSAYLSAKARFKRMLTPPDRRYLDFQLWQEGVALFAEYQLAAVGAIRLGRFEVAPGYHLAGLDRYAERLRRSILTDLRTVRLESSRRLAFYPVGAVEALVLDYIHPSWRDGYLENKFSLDWAFEEAGLREEVRSP